MDGRGRDDGRGDAQYPRFGRFFADTGTLRLHEKGAKRHDVPAHHRSAAAIDVYVAAAGLEDPKLALLPGR